MVYKVKVKLQQLQSMVLIINDVDGESVLFVAIRSGQVHLISLNKIALLLNYLTTVTIMKKTQKFWLKLVLSILRNMVSI